MLEGQELVDYFDSDLRVVEAFRRKDRKRIYQVERAGEFCVFKAYCPIKKPRKPNPNGFLREARILERLTDVERVSHLLKDYGVKEGYAAFLKEFAAGIHLDDALRQGVTEEWAREQVTETLRQIHGRGVAGLALNCGDIIVSPDFSKATIIDTGFGSFSEEYGGGDFERLKKEDFDRLEQSLRYGI